MLDSDRRWAITRALEDLVSFGRDADAVVKRLRSMRGGYSSGGNGGGSSGETQPERLSGERDQAEADMRRVDRLIAEIRERCTELVGIRDTTMPRRGTAALADEGCRSCARVSGKWSPVYRAGRCRWCYDRSLELQADPPLAAVRWYLEGRRVTVKMLRDAVADEARMAAQQDVRHRRDRKRRRARR